MKMILTEEMRRDIERANKELQMSETVLGFRTGLGAVRITYRDEWNETLQEYTIKDLDVNWTCMGNQDLNTTRKFKRLLEDACMYADTIRNCYKYGVYTGHQEEI